MGEAKFIVSAYYSNASGVPWERTDRESDVGGNLPPIGLWIGHSQVALMAA